MAQRAIQEVCMRLSQLETEVPTAAGLEAVLRCFIRVDAYALVFFVCYLKLGQEPRSLLQICDS